MIIYIIAFAEPEVTLISEKDKIHNQGQHNCLEWMVLSLSPCNDFKLYYYFCGGKVAGDQR